MNLLDETRLCQNQPQATSSHARKDYLISVRCSVEFITLMTFRGKFTSFFCFYSLTKFRSYSVIQRSINSMNPLKSAIQRINYIELKHFFLLSGNSSHLFIIIYHTNLLSCNQNLSRSFFSNIGSHFWAFKVASKR